MVSEADRVTMAANGMPSLVHISAIMIAVLPDERSTTRMPGLSASDLIWWRRSSATSHALWLWPKPLRSSIKRSSLDEQVPSDTTLGVGLESSSWSIVEIFAARHTQVVSKSGSTRTAACLCATMVLLYVFLTIEALLIGS